MHMSDAAKRRVVETAREGVTKAYAVWFVDDDGVRNFDKLVPVHQLQSVLWQHGGPDVLIAEPVTLELTDASIVGALNQLMQYANDLDERAARCSWETSNDYLRDNVPELFDALHEVDHDG